MRWLLAADFTDGTRLAELSILASISNLPEIGPRGENLPAVSHNTRQGLIVISIFFVRFCCSCCLRREQGKAQRGRPGERKGSLRQSYILAFVDKVEETNSMQCLKAKNYCASFCDTILIQLKSTSLFGPQTFGFLHNRSRGTTTFINEFIIIILFTLNNGNQGVRVDFVSSNQRTPNMCRAEFGDQHYGLTVLDILGSRPMNFTIGHACRLAK